MLKKKSHMFPWFLHVRVSFHVSYNCSLRFETRDTSLNAPGSALFPISYGEKKILRLTFPLEFWGG